MIDSFERQTKPTFKETTHRSYIKFGSMRDQDLAVGIRGGQLVLEACVTNGFPNIKSHAELCCLVAT